MSAREKLRFLILASMPFLLSITANAAVDGDTDGADGNAISAMSNLSDGPANCVDLNADCSTLMINYYGDSVEFVLFRREDLKDRAYRVDSTDYDPLHKHAAPVKERPISEKMKSDNNSQSFGIDFLRGFNDKGIDPAFNGEFSSTEDGTAGAGGMHNWAFAAATSTEYNFQQSNPAGIAVPSHFGEGALTFWDLEHVYQWEVEENVLDRDRRDISQVALSDIYLSPKTNSTSDPQIVVCELNDRNNCRPLSD